MYSEYFLNIYPSENTFNGIYLFAMWERVGWKDAYQSHICLLIRSNQYSL